MRSKVKDNPKLVRDMSSKAVLTTDIDGKRRFLEQREKERKTHTLESRINTLESELRELRSIIEEMRRN
jgi:hypothetical protein